jgi:hypothetical protein
MKRVLDISGYRLEIDPVETSRAYAHQLASCDCIYRKNFYVASSSIPEGLVQFLDPLGVDSLNPVYISEICENPDGSHLYLLFYDVIGHVISAPKSAEGSGHLSYPINVAELPESVTTRIAIEPYAPGHFTGPAVEFEFIMSLPWALIENP